MEVYKCNEIQLSIEIITLYCTFCAWLGNPKICFIGNFQQTQEPTECKRKKQNIDETNTAIWNPVIYTVELSTLYLSPGNY